jgi:hypothetical protein
MKILKNEINKITGNLIRAFLVLLLALGMGPPSEAQVSDPNSSASNNQLSLPIKTLLPKEEKPSVLSISGQLSNESNLVSGTSPYRASQTTLILAPSLKMGDAVISAKSEISKAGEKEEKLSVSDTRFTLTHTPLALTDYLSARGKINYILPTNEDSIEKDRLKSAASIEPSIKQDLRVWSLPATIEYRLGYRQNVHEYNVNASGDANIQWTLSQVLEAGIEIIDSLELSISGIWQSARTYKNFERSKFIISEELRYGVTKNWNLFVGHSNEGSLQPAERQGSTIKAFDEKSSVISAGLGFDF